MTVTSRFRLAASLACWCVLALRPGLAQQRMHPRWEIPGFDFSANGGWRARARRVAAMRNALLAQGNVAALNAPLASRFAGANQSAAIAGTIHVPALLFSYQGIDSLQFMRDTAQYNALLFGNVPPGGNPYTLSTFYTEMSNGLLAMLGTVMGWVRLPGSETTYTGQAGTCSGNPYGNTNCNGIFSNAALGALSTGFRQALAAVDTTIDFGAFDNDGPDGIPNSGDDDGFVDMIAFIHPTRDGACGGATNNHVWSHRFVLVQSSGGGLIEADYVTNDTSFAAGIARVRVRDYFAQSGLGGAGGCDTTKIMPMGTAAHEFGHTLGLPDLYDTNPNEPSEGIGRWGLMASGNSSSFTSPSRMEAWSLQQLGWIAIRTLTTSGTYAVGPVATADTAFLINPTGGNPRGEYFLLENRQANQSDTALIRIMCGTSGNPPGCGGGLLMWHVDAAKLLSGGGNNTVNAGFPKGLDLAQADGNNDLGIGANRGDAGDPYPGTSANAIFSVRTNPAAVKNSDGSFVGFAVDSIRQVVPGGELDFRLRFGGVTLVRGSDSTAGVFVDSQPFFVFRDLLDDGSSHTVSVPDTQLVQGGRRRLRYLSWSDGQPNGHFITGALAGDTIIASLARDFLVGVTTVGTGTVAATPNITLSGGGSFVTEGTPVQLIATPGAGLAFGGWTGDTVAANDTITLPLGRPYALTATFAPTLAISSATARPNALMGTTVDDTLHATGGTGSYTWQLVAGALPAGLALSSTGRITGLASALGNFNFTVRATSGGQTLDRPFTLAVVAPTLVTADVVARLLRGFGTLTAAQLKYLDLIGNNNGVFDVGDFKAWVDATGAP